MPSKVKAIMTQHDLAIEEVYYQAHAQWLKTWLVEHGIDTSRSYKLTVDIETGNHVYEQYKVDEQRDDDP